MVITFCLSSALHFSSLCSASFPALAIVSTFFLKSFYILRNNYTRKGTIRKENRTKTKNQKKKKILREKSTALQKANIEVEVRKGNKKCD